MASADRLAETGPRKWWINALEGMASWQALNQRVNVAIAEIKKLPSTSRHTETQNLLNAIERMYGEGVPRTEGSDITSAYAAKLMKLVNTVLSLPKEEQAVEPPDQVINSQDTTMVEVRPDATSTMTPIPGDWTTTQS